MCCHFLTSAWETDNIGVTRLNAESNDKDINHNIEKERFFGFHRKWPIYHDLI